MAAHSTPFACTSSRCGTSSPVRAEREGWIAASATPIMNTDPYSHSSEVAAMARGIAIMRAT